MKPTNRIEASYPLTAAQRKELSEAFDRLEIGQSVQFVIRPSSEAAGLLAELQVSYGRTFDWWPLQQDAQTYRVSIVKRAGDQPRTISEFLGADHLRLTELWQEFLEAVKTCELWHENLFTLEQGNLDGPRRYLAQFVFGLRRHIRMEEELLFPLFEERNRIPQGMGPTAVMRSEHREIEKILAALEKLQDAKDCATVIQAIESQPVHPSALLKSHDAKEENVLYPMADRTLGEVNELIRAMQAL